ncbi:MAG: hypothetical protein CGW95_06925 [Phenylobacterium zucineum]|nr:MAG: hypothetical protein CGW95_06925 [Phenylobacterium zucineum]
MMHLNRIGGFRRMEAISPLVMYVIGIEYQKIYGILTAAEAKYAPSEKVTHDECVQIINIMSPSYDQLIKLNCPAAAESSTKPARLMETESLTYGALTEIVKEIDGRIRDELKHTSAFGLTHAEAALFNAQKPLMGELVARRFESASFDIDEAGKCHDLGRSTAAVFHAFRVLEIGIKALAQCFQVKDLEQPKMKNWGAVLTAIEAAIKARWPKETDRDAGDGSLFWEVYTSMTAIKTPRNGTMHPARKYTEQEADLILRLVGNIMGRLAERLDENGEPRFPKRRVRGAASPGKRG